MKSMRIWSRRAALTAAAGAFSLRAFPALADASPLDGRRFKGEFLERGETSGDADTGAAK